MHHSISLLGNLMLPMTLEDSRSKEDKCFEKSLMSSLDSSSQQDILWVFLQYQHP